MARHQRKCICAIAVGLIGYLSASALASRGSETLLEGAKFVQAFSKQATDFYDQKLEPLQKERERLAQGRGNATEAEREQLDQQIANLDRQIADVAGRKRLASGQETAWQIFDGLAKMHETIQGIEEGLGQTDTWDRQIVWLDQVAGYELAQAREKIDQANGIVDYVAKLQALGSALNEADSAAPTPRVKAMMTSLYILFRAFEEFGDQVPVLEEFVKKYGEVGKALLQASERLDARLQRRSQGLLIEGYRDDGRVAAFDAQLPELAGERDLLDIVPLPGVRDAYAWPDGGVLVWDPAEERWHRRPDITPEDLLRRYTFFATYGNVNPTPAEVLGARAQRLVGLWIEAFPRVVAPGGEVQLNVVAERLDAARPVLNIALHSEAVTFFAGGPGVLEDRIVEPEEWTQWTAPEVSNSVYRLIASLPDEETGYTQVGPASVEVATGRAAELRLVAEPSAVEPRGDGHVSFEVVDTDGALFQQKGVLSVAADAGLELERPYWLGDAEARGAVTYHAPAEPGEYRVRVRFSGYIDAGWVLADNAMPCEAETTVTVRGAVAQTPPGTGPDAQPTPPTPPPVEDIEYIEFPPHYLVHIIETRTVGGPEAQDVWILHPEKPKEDGSLLTADGTGGWFANRTDQHQGPFTNSHQVCAALRALDLDSVLWGSGFLSCRPRRR